MADDGLSLDDIAGRVGVSRRHLVNLTRQSFGFTPKLLVRRARFLRSLLNLDAGAPLSAAGLDLQYCDYAHFLRDARMFLARHQASSWRGQSHFWRHRAGYECRR